MSSDFSLYQGRVFQRIRLSAIAVVGCLSTASLFAQTTAVSVLVPAPTSSTVTLMDAVAAAITGDPSIKLAEYDVQASRAHVLRAQGAFDVRVTSAIQEAHTYYPLTNYQHDLALTAGINTYSETLNFTQFQVGAQKLTQSGIQFLPQMTISRAADNLENLGGVNRTAVSFQVLFPLLRGRGREVTTAPLRNAKLEFEGKLAQQKETASQTVYATLTAYWRYVASEERLKQRQAQLARATQLNESVTTLIRADRLPASESHQSLAALENEKSGVISARQGVLEARQALGDAMALEPLDSFLLGTPSDDLPEPAPAIGEIDPAALVSVAMEHRADLTLAANRIDEAALQRKTAAEQLRSRLDLTVKSEYQGLELGTGPAEYFGSAASRVQGADISGSLTYTWDPSNKDANGKLTEAQIEAKRALEAQSVTRRTIGSQVIIALGELQASRAALAQARMAEQQLRQVRSDTQDRLSAAVGVLNDVLTAEDALASAELNTLEAHTRYALAVARLRYATGTLLGGDTDHPSLERINLVTPPAQ